MLKLKEIQFLSTENMGRGEIDEGSPSDASCLLFTKHQFTESCKREQFVRTGHKKRIAMQRG